MSHSSFNEQSSSLLSLHTRMLTQILSDYKEISISESSFNNPNDILLLCIQIITTINSSYANDKNAKTHITSISELICFLLSSLYSCNIFLDTQLEQLYQNDINESNRNQSMALLILLYVFFENDTFPYDKLMQLNQSNQFEMLKLIHSSINCEKSSQGKIIKYLLSLHMKISFLEIQNSNHKQNNNNNEKKNKKRVDSFQDEESSTTKNESSCQRNTSEEQMINIEKSINYSSTKKYILESPMQSTFKDSKHYTQSSLTEQDYLMIILKKDCIISQLECQIKLNKANEKDTFQEEKSSCKENELEYYKQENKRLERRYEMEFELMASALYNLGFTLLKQKEETNLTAQTQSNWLLRQRQSYLTGNY